MKPHPKFHSWHLELLATMALLLLIAPLFQPLLRDTLPVTHDGHHHIYRLYALDQGIRGGSLWQRWFPGMGFAYGFPVLNFYSPLIYYIGEIFHIFGLGFLDTFRVLLALGFVLPALAFYAFARGQLGHAGALIGALVYTYATYHIGDGFIRAALPEHWAFLFPPLLLLIMQRIASSANIGWTVVGSILLAAFFLVHNLSVVLFAPLLMLYGLGLLWSDIRNHKIQSARRTYRAWWRLGLMALLGVGLAAFFILPGAHEVQYIHASTVSTGLQEYKDMLMPSLGSLIRFPGTRAPAGPYPISTRLFYIILIGAGGAIVAWPRLNKNQRIHFLFVLLMGLFAGLMMLRISEPVVSHLPQLSYLQFPWRWNALFTFALAYLTGFALSWIVWLPQSARPRVTVGITLLFLLIFAWWIIPHSFPDTLQTIATVPTGEKPLEESDLKPGILAKYDFQTGLWLRNYGGPWLFEYLPIWAEDVRDNWFLPDENPTLSSSLAFVPQIKIRKYAALRQEFDVNSPQSFTMRWHSFYFPGWQVLVDGKPIPTTPDSYLGLVTAQIPAGTHRVILRFGSTPARRIGVIITVLSLFGLALLLLWQRQWRLAGLLILLTLVIFLAFQYRQKTASTIYTPQTPRETWTIFEDRAQLLGYHVQGKPQSGSSIFVTLHWQALRQMAENNQVFVMLMDYEGRSWSKTEHQPVFGFTPTTRWQAGEIIHDTYELSLSSDIPEGNYQIRIGLYEPTTLTRYTAHNLNGELSDQIWLGDITITVK